MKPPSPSLRGFHVAFSYILVRLQLSMLPYLVSRLKNVKTEYLIFYSLHYHFFLNGLNSVSIFSYTNLIDLRAKFLKYHTCNNIKLLLNMPL